MEWMTTDSPGAFTPTRMGFTKSATSRVRASQRSSCEIAGRTHDTPPTALNGLDAEGIQVPGHIALEAVHGLQRG